MSYIKNNIFAIYHNEIPDFIKPFLRSKVLKRLDKMDQYCGTEHSKLFEYWFPCSRLEHSIGVALILWNFTKDKKQTLAWLFHDVSHTAFSHVGDVLLWDIETQSSSEKYITEILTNDPVIMTELDKLDIKIEEVEDFSIYPVADNDGPQLASDRLEYTLLNAVSRCIIDLQEAREMFNDMIVWKNEQWIDEIWFKARDLAEKFAIISVMNDRDCYSNNWSVFLHTILANILRYMIDNNYFTHDDLYVLNDEDIINMIENSGDEYLLNSRDKYKNTTSLDVYDVCPNDDQKYVSSKCKKRYIDPLVFEWWKCMRVSSFSSKFVNLRDIRLNQKEEWIRIS